MFTRELERVQQSVKTKTRDIIVAYHKGHTIQWTNDNSKSSYIVSAKREKACVSEP